MIINNNSPVYNTLIVFTAIMILIHMKKPDILYDTKKKEYRQFGTSNGKTLLPIYIVGILLSFVLYIYFNHLSHNVSIKKSNTINNIETFNTAHHIQQLQTQMQHIIQQQIIQQQLSNNQHLISNTIKSNISLPNNLNVYN